MKELETKQEGEPVWWALDEKTWTYADGMHFLRGREQSEG